MAYLRSHGPTLFLTTLVLLTVFGLSVTLQELEQIRAHTELLHLQRRLEAVLREAAHQPDRELQLEYESLLESIERLGLQRGVDLLRSLQQNAPGRLVETPLLPETLRNVAEQRQELSSLIIPSLWGRALGWLWLILSLWVLWLAMLVLALATARRSGSSKGGTLIPLSFTRMAIPTLQEPGSSARGYTERVLQSLSNLLVLAGPDGSIQMVNEAFCASLGHRRGEVLGRPLSSVLGSEVEPGVRNKEATFLTSEGGSVPVLVSCSAVLNQEGETEGLVVVAQDITDRKTAERSLRHSEQRLRALMERLVSAQEDERQKVARDLHDGMLQLVIAAEMQLTSFRKKLSAESDLDAKLQSGIECLAEAVKEGRRLISNLRPPTLDKFGLQQSLKQETVKIARELECQGEFRSEPEGFNVPTPLETTAFRICQEAFNNIRKYAQPSRIKVHLNLTQGNLLLTVEDDGIGFDSESESFQEGVGLHSMRERAELAGGTFQFSSEPGRGTRLTAILPVEG